MKRGIKMGDELSEVLMGQYESFIKKFGREPGPEDPVFFDPDCNVPTPLAAAKLRMKLTELAHEAGFDDIEVA